VVAESEAQHRHWAHSWVSYIHFTFSKPISLWFIWNVILPSLTLSSK